jgi:hypothetical protein
MTMAATWKSIDKYLVRHYGRQSGEGENDTLANIICYKNYDIVGYINFYLERHVPESKLETFATGSPKQFIMLRFAIDRIDEILDTLRQEKPIHIAVDSSQKVGWVGTGAEPIGEEEGV